LASVIQYTEICVRFTNKLKIYSSKYCNAKYWRASGINRPIWEANQTDGGTVDHNLLLYCQLIASLTEAWERLASTMLVQIVVSFTSHCQNSRVL